MGLGLSFGSSKQKSTTDSTINKNETTNQTQNQTQNQTGTSSSTQTSTGSTQTSGTTATKNTGATTNTAVGTSAETQKSTSFSDMILGALESSTLNALNAANQAQVDTNVAFDRNSFVEGGVASAAAAQQAQLEQSLNGLFDSTGGTASGNSMAALLANRLTGDAAANIAGVRSNLEGQATEIERNNIATALAGAQQTQGFAAQLLSALKGGATTATGQTATSQQQAGTSQQVGEQQQAQSQTQQSTTQQDTTQQLVSIINSLLSGNTQTQATEHSKTTGKKSGGGIGLSI